MINIDDVLNKSDLLTYVTLAGGKPEKTGNRYACACPLHGGENPTAFSIYFDNGRWKWHCFTDNCGTGDAISFVEKWQKFTEKIECGKKYTVFMQACEFILGEKINDPTLLYKSSKERLEEAHIEEVAAKERKEARLKEFQLTEKHLLYHNSLGEWAKDLWNKRGLDESMQDWFCLGSCDDFIYKIKNDLYHSPSLSIPFLGENKELLYLQHRLVNPVNPKDKYRPDMESREIDLPPFLAVPLMGFDGDIIIVVEGAIKAMVTWAHVIGDVQVIGVPIQGGYKRLTEKLMKKNPIIIPDPQGATTNEHVLKQPEELAKATGGKILSLPGKVDDYLIEMNMGHNDFHKLLKQARRV